MGEKLAAVKLVEEHNKRERKKKVLNEIHWIETQKLLKKMNKNFKKWSKCGILLMFFF